MKFLLMLAAMLVIAVVLSGCMATAPTAAAPVYPAWLEMKDGYAEACAAAGKDGCVPMTRAELEAYALEVVKKTMAYCRRSMT